MKIPWIIIFSILARTSLFGEIRIEGSVSGSATRRVELFYPINGFYNGNILQKNSISKLDSKNIFRFSIEINTPAFITIKVDHEPIWIAVEGNDNIKLEIHLDSLTKFSHKGFLKIEGTNSCGNLFINNFNFEPYDKYIPIKNILDNVSQYHNKLLETLKDTIQMQLSPLNSFFHRNLISREYFDFVTKNFRALLYEEVIIHIIRKSKIYNFYSIHEIDSLKNSIFSSCNPLDTMLYAGLNTRFYIFDYYKLLTVGFSDSILITDKKNVFIRKTFVPFLKIKDKKLQENLWGIELYNLVNLFKEKVSSSDIEAFQYFYPFSIWVGYINNLRRSITSKSLTHTYLTEILKDVHFVDSLEKIQTVESLISLFHGKPIFIDIWATWCIPCRMEFEFNEEVDSFLNSNNIVNLFISVDNPLMINSWITTVEEYPLKGYHVLASKGLINSLKKNFYGTTENFGIPRYIIIDANGHILERDANRPSSGNKLFNELKYKLKLK